MAVAYLIKLGNEYYDLYGPHGPVFVANPQQAWRFPDRAHAERVLNSDERLHGAVIVDAPDRFYPR